MYKITKRTIKHGVMNQPVTTRLDVIVDRICQKPVLAERDMLQLVFGATFGRNGIDHVSSMTGLLLMSTAEESVSDIGQWLRQVAQVPYTVLAYRSLDRRVLNVVIRTERSDGQPSQSTTDYLTLLRQAQKQAASIYQAMTDCRLKTSEVTIDMGCPISFDPQAVYRPDAQAMPVNVAGWKEQYHDPLLRMTSDGTLRHDADREADEHARLEYYTCLRQALEEDTTDADDEQLLVALANYCRKARLDEEACVKRTLWQYRFGSNEDLVRKVFRTTYAKKYQGKPMSQMNQKERIARTISDFFQRRYQLRYNEVKQLVEFKPNDQMHLLWQPLTDRDLHRMAFEEMMEGGQAWLVDLQLYVNSSLVRRYNPILEFLANVGTWNRKRNYIEDFARRLKTDWDRWPHFFHRWLLAMVAQAMDVNRDYGNSVVPMIIGRQAMKKSTFCKNILPYSLRDYYMDDIKMDNSEQVERVLGRMWLVNIDEYNSKTDREQAKIKRLLTEKDVQVRKMRSDQYTMTPRLCSFIATTNDRHPLCDATGSRRYLCVETTAQANMSGTIDYQQMYAQAVWEIEHGVQYWFDNDDEREIEAHNKAYRQVTSIEEALTNIFQPAKHDKKYFFTTTDIHQQLREVIGANSMPTLSKLGRELKRLNFPEGAQDGTHGYYLRTRRQQLKKQDE